MADGIAFLVTLLLAGGGLLALLRWLLQVDRRRAAMPEEEYEARERRPSLLGVGMMAYEQMLRPDAKRAAEHRMDAEQGHLPGGDHEGEKLTDQ